MSGLVIATAVNAILSALGVGGCLVYRYTECQPDAQYAWQVKTLEDSRGSSGTAAKEEHNKNFPRPGQPFAIGGRVQST